MRKIYRFGYMAACLALFSFAGEAAAYDSAIRAGVSSHSLKYQDQSTSFTGTSGGAHVGYAGRIVDYFSFEVRLGSAGKSSGGGLTLQPGLFLSLLAQPTLPVGNVGEIYGLIGATSLALGRTAGNGTQEIVGRLGFSYGVGGDVRINEHMAVGGEYLVYARNLDFGPQNGSKNWTGVTRAQVSFSGAGINFKYLF